MTLKAEPRAVPGYLLIGLGATITNVASLWLEFHLDASYWFLTAMAIGYAIIAAGLLLLIRSRRAPQGGGDS